MSACHVFSAFSDVRQFWVVPKGDLGPVAINPDNDKGPQLDPFANARDDFVGLLRRYAPRNDGGEDETVGEKI